MIRTEINFQEAILLYRTRKHMSKAQLAKAMGVSLHTISAYENGTSFPRTMPRYEKLAQILGIEMKYIHEFASLNMQKAMAEHGYNKEHMQDLDQVEKLH